MDMSSLFPSDSVTGGVSPDPSVHVSFRAGILNRDTSSNQVTADPRPGTFQIMTSLEDGLVHIQWKPHGNEEAEQDLILISGEVEMKQVMSCPASARVYVLKWHDSDTRLFLWMQERDVSQDATKLSLVNSILEHGPPPQQHSQNESITQSLEQSPVSNSSQDSAHDSDSPSASEPSSTRETTQRTIGQPVEETTEAASRPNSGSGVAEPQTSITIEQVRAALAPRQAHLQEMIQQQEVMHTTPTPSDLLQLDLMGSALADEQVKGRLSEVMEHAPPDDRDPANICTLLRSPSLRAQAAALSAALGTEQADELLRSFGFTNNEPSSTTSGFGVKALVDALLCIQQEAEQEHEPRKDHSHGEE